MKSTTIIVTLISFLSTAVLAHPPNFAPNHAQLQKRCPPFDPAGVKNIGNGAGTQFIGGQCLSGADCASGCCANPCGICSGVGAQNQAGKTGCGFGGDAPAGTGSSAGDTNTGNANGSGSVGNGNNNNANNNSNPNDDTDSGSTGNGSGTSCNGQ